MRTEPLPLLVLAGFLGSGSWSRMDLLAKAILNVVSIVVFIWLALKITRRSKQRSVDHEM